MPEKGQLDIGAMFDDFLGSGNASVDGIAWDEDPVSFKDFASSPTHMGFPTLSQRQMDAMEFMFGSEGDDPRKMFENEHFLAVLAWGKGGFSKDKIITDVKTGESHTVEEWSKLGKDIFVYAYNFHKNKKVITKIKPFFKEGHGKIYKIKTKSGRIFYVDAEHKFYTDKFIYQKVRELKNGDKIGKLRLCEHKLSAIRSSKEFDNKRLDEIVEECDEGQCAKHGCFEFENNGRQHYDSVYELERMTWLDKNGYIFRKGTFRIPYFYRGAWHDYIPDLLVIDRENANVWVEEIKSVYILNKDTDENTVKFNAAKEYCLRNGLEFHVYNADEYRILDNIEFDEIESIEEVGEDDFYGFCNPLHKNIIIDDVIHHNSGKDTISVLATLYTVYVLLCCKDPLSLFKGVNSDYIDILNVAYNARQAKDVFFAKLVKSVKEWRWLRERYPYVDSGKVRKEKNVYATDEVVNIKMDSILFPKSIRAFAKNSQQDAAEGTNLLVWIADEFSAFSDKNNKSNATEMFDTLRTSSSTRFQNYGKGFVISFTRYKNDPILRLVKQYEDDINVYTDVASTFEVRPRETFVGEWGEWNGIEMPVSFISDFVKNPEGSRAKYLCQPPDSADPWITEGHFIDDSISSRSPMFEFSEHIRETIHGNMICKRIERQKYTIPDKGFILAGDLGTTNDRTVLTMWHDETSYLANDSIVKHYVQDFILSWIPDKTKNRKVDINNVEGIIKSLIFDYHIPVNGIYFDHWNSAQLLDELANRGIHAQAYTLKLEDFTAFRSLLYGNALSFIDNGYQSEEMKRLTYGKNGKPDHVQGEHDDHFRVNCLAITALEGFKGSSVVVNEDGTFLRGTKGFKNLNGAFGGLSFKGSFHNGDSDMFDMEQGEL